MRGGRYPHIIAAVMAEPWAIDPDSLAWAAIQDVLAIRAAGERLSEDEIAARIEAAANGPRSGGGRRGGVALLPLYGVIMPRANMLGAMSGGTSAEGFGADLEAAVADPEVASIVIDADSPGGNVRGITELAAIVRQAAERKPIAVVANHVLASAALWGMAGATELVATPSAVVGSIGVIAEHEDLSGHLEQKGVRTTVITAGRFKGEGNPYGPLAEEGLAEIQSKVDDTYGVMVRDIARGRSVGVELVRGASWGEGRTLSAKQALEVGMVDRIDTLDATIRRASAGQLARPTGAAATGYVLVEGTAGQELELDGSSIAAASPAAPATPAPEPDESPERVVPARQAQLRTRLAAHAGGHSLVGR